MTETFCLETFHVFPVPARKVWALLADFAAIQQWWPRGGAIEIERVVVEGEGVGMVRHIHNRGMRRAISERLDFIDDANMILRLSHVGSEPPNLPFYQATGQLSDLSGDRSRFTYRSELRVARGAENVSRDHLLAAYASMFKGLQAAASLPAGD
ncbi:MAG: SRPBCC family protein [Steroidobacteraceae bacterium]|nr:SRPBCC family protein [Steroidobacteraceae bacterium]